MLQIGEAPPPASFEAGRVDRALLRGLAASVTGRLREFETRRPLSPARYGEDWGLSFAEPYAGAPEVTAQFVAHTPEGAVFLQELGSAGFFDSVTWDVGGETAYT